ncbi:MAG: hypothetical protein J5764_01895 [Bacteroidales bacterium]|nr:hypothetical protein [Bacteroidales bacterium]
MKFRSIIFILALAIAAAACKKEEKSTVLPYLNGDLVFNMPDFYTVGETLEISLGGKYLKGEAKRSSGDNGGVGYYFYNNLLEKRDTVRKDTDPLTDPVTYQFAVKDTIGTFTLTCTAYASGYYATTATKTFSMVNSESGKSVKGYSEYPEDVIFTDARDNISYRATRIDDLLWMRSNLTWTGAGRCFRGSLNDFSNPGTVEAGKIFGRFYSWTEARSACPEGWRLPTNAEWAAVARKFNGGASDEGDLSDIPGAAGSMMEAVSFNGVKLWEYWKGVDITNASRLSVLPSGYAVNNVSGLYSFHGYLEYANLWTSDEVSGRGVYRYIYKTSNTLYCGLADKDSFAASVRCVKNAN